MIEDEEIQQLEQSIKQTQEIMKDLKRRENSMRKTQIERIIELNNLDKIMIMDTLKIILDGEMKTIHIKNMTYTYRETHRPITIQVFEYNEKNGKIFMGRTSNLRIIKICLYILPKYFGFVKYGGWINGYSTMETIKKRHNIQ